MKLITKDIEVSKVTNTLLISFIDRRSVTQELEKLKGKSISVELKVHRKKRSLDANSYLWVLCDKIAKVINSTKELVYQQAILDVGVFETIPIKTSDIEKHNTRWNSIGLGYFTLDMGESKMQGFNKVQRYYGSSTYNTKEMARLIDEIVFECKELDIEIMSDSELKSLKEAWK